MPCFFIFKLPSLASENIIRLMGPSDLLSLSQASLKIKRVVKRIAKRDEYQMSLYISPNVFSLEIDNGLGKQAKFSVEYSNPGFRALYPWKLRNKYFIPVDIDWTSKTTYWGNQTNGLKTIYRFLNDVFCIKNVSYKFARAEDHIYVHILSHFSTIHQVPLLDYSYSGRTISDLLFSTCQYLLNEFSSVEILSNFSPGFNYRKLQNLNIKYLKIEYAQEVTLDLVRNCQNVELNRVSFTKTDLNQFIRSWVEDKDCKLKYLSVEYYGTDFFEVLDGLKTEQVTNRRNRHYHSNSSFKLYRGSEMAAMVFFKTNRFILNAKEEFLDEYRS